MRLRKVAAALACCFALAASGSAQVVHVPGDYFELQDAIDAAAPDTTIVVSGGTYLRVVIDKPLTIIGSQTFDILPDSPGGGLAEPAVRLTGPGHGEVRLSNVRIGMHIYALAFYDSEPMLEGDGFDAVHLYDCFLNAPWAFDWNGIYPGVDTIDVDVPLLWIERSEVQGGDTATTASYSFSHTFDAGLAIRSTGTVVLLDTEVEGGSGPSIVWDDPQGNCPAPCPGGLGGDGIHCDRLFQSSNSTVTAGTGTRWLALNGGFCCEGDPGVAMVVNEHIPLAGGLRATDAPVLGQNLTVELDAPGSASMLVLATGVGMPVVLGPNHLFLDDPLVFIGVVPTPTTAVLPVPASPSLAGFGFGMQLYGVAGWSRPMAGVLIP